MNWLKKILDGRKAHRVAIKVARNVYDRHKDQSVVVTEGAGFVSAASPSRVAWDEYFYSMADQGFSAWSSKRKFDRAMKRWRAEK